MLYAYPLNSSHRISGPSHATSFKPLSAKKPRRRYTFSFFKPSPPVAISPPTATLHAMLPPLPPRRFPFHRLGALRSNWAQYVHSIVENNIMGKLANTRPRSSRDWLRAPFRNHNGSRPPLTRSINTKRKKSRQWKDESGPGAAGHVVSCLISPRSPSPSSFLFPFLSSGLSRWLFPRVLFESVFLSIVVLSEGHSLSPSRIWYLALYNIVYYHSTTTPLIDT